MTKQEFWNRCLRAYDALNQLDDYRKGIEQVAERLAVHPGCRILDAGSGTGNLSIHLRRNGARVLSMDFSPVALQIHKEKDPAADVLQASLESALPLPGGAFDRVACTSVLFAISRPGMMLALREFRRVLRPGGRLLVTVMKPNQSKFRALWTHLRSRFRALPAGDFLREMRRTLLPLLKMLYYNIRMYGLAGDGGYRRFSRDELLDEIAGAGFVNLRYDSTYGSRFHMVEAEAPGVFCPDGGRSHAAELVAAGQPA